MAKAEFVNKMFNDIAPKYDLLNDVLSVGTHRLWKRKFINFALKQKPNSALDCATGTGDIAFQLKEKISGKVVGIDFSSGMIDYANERAKTASQNVEFKVADIQKVGANYMIDSEGRIFIVDKVGNIVERTINHDLRNTKILSI